MFTQIVAKELENKAIIVDKDFILTITKEVIKCLKFFEEDKKLKDGRLLVLFALKNGRYFIVTIDAFKEDIGKNKPTLHGFTLEIDEINQDSFLDKLSEIKKAKKNRGNLKKL